MQPTPSTAATLDTTDPTTLACRNCQAPVADRYCAQYGQQREPPRVVAVGLTTPTG